MNSFVIVRENTPSNRRQKCLQEAGDILGNEEGPVTLSLIAPIPTLAPGSVGVIAGISRTCLKGCLVIFKRSWTMQC